MMATLTASDASRSAAVPRRRETFRLSRSREYLSEPELTKQIGYPRHLWVTVILKELLDNALDHCEEIGRVPEVEVTVTDDSLAVRDNGDGIPAETVEAMLDFQSRVSSREAYRCPTRGAQGNAGKCLIAIPYVLAGKEGSALIEAQGVRHQIRVALDPLSQEPDIEYRPEPHKVQNGTFVKLLLGELPSKLPEAGTSQIVLFCQVYAALNPHLTLKLVLSGRTQTWPRTVDRCPKWTAAEPEPAGWHDLESFERLVGACIAKDRDTGRNRLLRDFVKTFAGLKRSEALKAVFDSCGLGRKDLADLVKDSQLDRPRIQELLTAMQEEGKSPSPEKLGCLGRDHFDRVLAALGGGSSKYKRIMGFDGRDLPFVVEAAFAETRSRLVLTGCNFSPSIDRPAVRMLDGLLREQMIDEESTVTLILHLAQVAPTYLDRGKSVVDVDEAVRDALEQAVRSVTEDYRKRRKRAERDAAAEERARERSNRARPTTSLKEAIAHVLEVAIEKASGGGQCDFSDRDLYYAARELVQTYTEERLTQKYFDKVVDGWEGEHGLIPGRQRDPRGFLLEPHTGRRIPLGTKAVEDYNIPAHLYDTIIYVEKKGLLSKFQLGRIGERFDCAIIAAEGYAVRAAKALIQAAQQGHRMKVLCFNDADPYGYNIARTLSQATGAHRFEIEVIDAGLHLEEALAMGLATETFTRKNALPKGLKLTEVERDYFTGTPRRVIGKNGKPKTHYVNCRRVELNALSANPAAFVTWVEAKLVQHGVASKLIPPKKVIEQRGRQQRERVLHEQIEQRLMEALDLPSKVEQVVKRLTRRVLLNELPAQVEAWGEQTLPQSWMQFVDDEVTRLVRDEEQAIRREVRRALA